MKWTFVGRNKDKDVYRFTFTRKTKINSDNQVTESREIQFAGERVTVFEDELHAVVMESPSKADTEQAKKH